MRHKMYLICNIGLVGGKITYCQSACMVVYQPTQEKDVRREKLVRHKSTQETTKQINPIIIIARICHENFLPAIPL